MCNCRNDLQDRLLKSVKEQLPADATNIKITLTGYGFFMEGNTLVTKPVMPAEVTYQQPLKKEPSRLKDKKMKQSLIASFCPFCGEDLRIKKEDDNDN